MRPWPFTAERKKGLAKAKQLDKQGKTPAETREQTGWFIGLDGNSKYAIDDSNAQLLVDEDRMNTFAKDKTAENAPAFPLFDIRNLNGYTPN